jgi:hypothetical protein
MFELRYDVADVVSHASDEVLAWIRPSVREYAVDAFLTRCRLTAAAADERRGRMDVTRNWWSAARG